MEIRINTAALWTSANRLNSVTSTLNEVSTGMKQVSCDIESCWKSELTGEYLDYFEDVRNRVRSLMGDIQDIQTALRNTAKSVEQAERDAKAIVMNNSTDVNKR